MDRAKLFLEQLPYIERLIAWRCRTYGLSVDESEDFSQQVKIRLIEDDYALLGKLKQRSTLKTFLGTVITNQAKDFLIAKNGKRRPTVLAKRLGPDAVKLEELLRDGLSFPEAVLYLKQNLAVETSEGELYKIAQQLKLRPRRKIKGVEELAQLEDPRFAADPAIDQERNESARKLETVLTAAIRNLPEAQDRLILRARFFEGLTVARIAKSLGLDQSQLYRRIESLCKRELRQALEATGLGAETVLDLLDCEVRIEVEL